MLLRRRYFIYFSLLLKVSQDNLYNVNTNVAGIKDICLLKYFLRQCQCANYFQANNSTIPSCHCNRLEFLMNFYCEQTAVLDVFDLKLVLTSAPSDTNTNTQKIQSNENFQLTG